jgi:hypothetical protein
MSKQQAINTMIGLLLAVIVFHLSIITQLIPYTIVWAGKLNTVQEMRTFEMLSIIINLILLFVFLLKGNYIKHKIPHKIINGFLWFFFVVFILNTIGNLFAKTLVEKIVFTPLTLISALLIGVILRNKKDMEHP